MSILDIFSFKKQLNLVFTKENFKATLNYAKRCIVEQAKTELVGAEKKTIVDTKVIYFIRERITTIGCTNRLVLWVTERIIDTIPIITQAIYDFLKEKVENL